jgi:hypothetical protein
MALESFGRRIARLEATPAPVPRSDADLIQLLRDGEATAGDLEQLFAVVGDCVRDALLLQAADRAWAEVSEAHVPRRIPVHPVDFGIELLMWPPEEDPGPEAIEQLTQWAEAVVWERAKAKFRPPLRKMLFLNWARATLVVRALGDDAGHELRLAVDDLLNTGELGRDPHLADNRVSALVQPLKLPFDGRLVLMEKHPD